MSRGATARLFAAVDLPEQVRERLSAWGREARAATGGSAWMRVLDPDLLHVTLCFLGSRPVEEIDPLAAALAPAAGAAPELSLAGPLWLPPRRPRTLGVSVHDEDGELGRLQARVAQALAGVGGWQPEHRRFRAHVTVARTRGEAPPSRAHDRLPATPSLSFSAESLSLYRSWLAPTGASYEALERFTLVP
jgi:2'-5' RNA ligase